MRPRVQKEKFSLSADDIDRLSEWVGNALAQVGGDRQTRLRTRLTVEQILLRMQEHLGQDVEAAVTLDARFRRIHRPRLYVEMPGEPFNPLGNLDGEMGEWDRTIRAATGLVPLYDYAYGKNIIKLIIPHHGLNSVLLICCSIMMGLVVGVFGAAVIPSLWLQVIANLILVPTYDMWIRMLNALSGPVVFLTVVSTMINTQGIVRRGGNSVLVIVRYFMLSIVDVVFAVACVVIARPLGNVSAEVDGKLFFAIIDAIPKIVPSNVVEPFVDSNTVQLLFLAFILGYVLIRLGEQALRLKGVLREANMVGLRLAGWMSRLVPIFVGAFLCLELWRGEVVVLAGIWKPLLVAVLISSVLLAIVIVNMAYRTHTSPIVIAKRMAPSFITAIRTGSLDESYPQSSACCTKSFGIEESYTQEALPQGLVLYMPISAVGTIVFTLYAARIQQTEVGLLWFLLAIIMVVVVFVATPPVPGANLLAYVVLFETLGIPEDVLLDAMTFDIVFGIFAGAANQALLQLEMVYQAGRFGFLDREGFCRRS